MHLWRDAWGKGERREKGGRGWGTMSLNYDGEGNGGRESSLWYTMVALSRGIIVMDGSRRIVAMV